MEPTTIPLDTFQEPENNNYSLSAVISKSAHPIALCFQVVFKLVSILVYLLLGLFTSNFIIQFVVTVTLVSFDFWTVKNITGRLLVGLRWWSQVQEDGSTRWRFEAREVRETRLVFGAVVFNLV